MSGAAGLVLTEVSAGYGETIVLEGISLVLSPGQTLTVLGRNGVGKTTLLATIMTLDPIRFVFDVSETDYLHYTRLFLSGALASSREKNPVRIRLADETDWTRTGRRRTSRNTPPRRKTWWPSATCAR